MRRKANGLLPPLELDVAAPSLALVHAPHIGTLDDAQRETAQALRAGILALAEGGDGFRAQAV